MITWNGQGKPPKRKLEPIVDLNRVLIETEIHWITEALNLAHGDKAKAARLLKLGRTTLFYRIQKLGIVPRFEAREAG